ncbi:MAG: hypothetical protein AAFR75_00070 [Pseudomonadota bacterium]
MHFERLFAVFLFAFWVYPNTAVAECTFSYPIGYGPPRLPDLEQLYTCIEADQSDPYDIAHMLLRAFRNDDALSVVRKYDLSQEREFVFGTLLESAAAADAADLVGWFVQTQENPTSSDSVSDIIFTNAARGRSIRLLREHLPSTSEAAKKRAILSSISPAHCAIFSWLIDQTDVELTLNQLVDISIGMSRHCSITQLRAIDEHWDLSDLTTVGLPELLVASLRNQGPEFEENLAFWVAQGVSLNNLCNGSVDRLYSPDSELDARRRAILDEARSTC